VRGPKERGRAIVRSDIDVGFLIQQRTNCLLVSVPGRFDQPEIAACMCSLSDDQQRYDEQRRYRRQGVRTADARNDSGDAEYLECGRSCGRHDGIT
jgi:hypothetical protein